MTSDQSPRGNVTATVRLHVGFVWWSLLAFLCAGICLEALHAFKIGWYLEEDFETRRLMWTLGHAHGTLLALVHGMFAFTLHLLGLNMTGARRMASPCLIGASVLLPGGFFLGGIFIYGGDPGIGVWLVPLGAVLLLAAVLMTATAAWGSPAGGAEQKKPKRRKG